ncbi:MAG: hypothetical protein ABIB61_04150 [Candidatus Shapirobacteria bacterium]
MLKKIKLLIQKRGFRFFLPMLYLSGLLLSLILVLLSFIFPFLNIKGGLLYADLPLGLILGKYLLLPAGIFIGFFPANTPPGLLISFSFLFPLLAYYLLGLVIDLVWTKINKYLLK